MKKKVMSLIMSSAMFTSMASAAASNAADEQADTTSDTFDLVTLKKHMIKEKGLDIEDYEIDIIN